MYVILRWSLYRAKGKVALFTYCQPLFHTATTIDAFINWNFRTSRGCLESFWGVAHSSTIVNYNLQTNGHPYNQRPTLHIPVIPPFLWPCSRTQRVSGTYGRRVLSLGQILVWRRSSCSYQPSWFCQSGTNIDQSVSIAFFTNLKDWFGLCGWRWIGCDETY